MRAGWLYISGNPINFSKFLFFKIFYFYIFFIHFLHHEQDILRSKMLYSSRSKMGDPIPPPPQSTINPSTLSSQKCLTIATHPPSRIIRHSQSSRRNPIPTRKLIFPFTFVKLSCPHSNHRLLLRLQSQAIK